jgi:signal transduction histidine kinase
MKPPAYPEATFLSEVTASATHELRNVLAIIKESNGLMGDMVQLCAGGGNLDEGRMRRAGDRVDAQVKRGADILSGLNRLSHCLDVDSGILDLQEEVELVAFMIGRKARNRRQTLTVDSGASGAQVQAPPLQLQMALYAAVKLCIEAFPEGSSLALGVRREAAALSVECLGESGSSPNGPIGTDGEPWARTEELFAAVGGQPEAVEGGWGIRVFFGSA